MFVLGVGAHKAGTTWLSYQLMQDSRYRSIFAKEVNYWSRLYDVDADRAPIHRLRAVLTDGSDRRQDLELPRSHWKYFARISMWDWRAALGSDTITADISPSYSGLPRTAFAHLASELNRRSVDYRVVYLLRDRASRVVSAWQMNRRKSRRFGREYNSVLWSDEENDSVLKYAWSWNCQVRTRYEVTIENLVSVFDSSRLFFGFQEVLSSPGELQRLGGFLGITINEASAAKAVNSGAEVSNLRPETWQHIAMVYRETYSETAQLFPEVKELWPGFSAIS